MKKYRVYAVVEGSSYLGEIEADSKKEALEKAKELHEGTLISFCHQCSSKVDDLTATENIEVEEVEEVE